MTSTNDVYFDDATEAALRAANLCIEDRPDQTTPCQQGYKHPGKCDWYLALAEVVARHNRAQAAS